MTREQEDLIVAHLALVPAVARQVARGVPSWIGLDELIALGNFGLCEAALRYDATLDPNFWRFALWRVRGRMLDATSRAHYPRRYRQLKPHWEQELFWIEEGVYEPSRQTLPADLISPDRDPEQQSIAREEKRRLRAAVQSLPPDELRGVASYLRTSSIRDVAAQNGKSVGWAHYFLHRAFDRVRQQLTECAA